jgi:hypothetical protein
MREGAFFDVEADTLPQLHADYLREDYFPIIGKILRYTPLKNKRGPDMQVVAFNDAFDYVLPVGFDLPKPNKEASYKSLAKYAKCERPLTVQDVLDFNLAWEWTFRHFSPFMGDSKVLELDEAISRLNMKTSSGLPWSTKFTTKGALFDNYPEIEIFLAKDWNDLVKEDWTCIATNSLKEELRPDAKIIKNSIRTFTAMPVHATVHGTRLFADMNEKMYNTNLQHSSAIGLSPMGGDWQRLFDHLKIFPEGWALDEAEYDSSLRAHLMWGCALFRWRCLAPEYQTADNLNRIKNYYRNLINTVICTLDGFLIMKKLGNPSGSVNTVTDNTLILYTLLAYAWIKATKGTEHENYTSFDTNTRLALVGDDNTWTVHPDFINIYNAEFVISVWKGIGITTTTDSIAPRPVKDLDFLSANFINYDGIMLPYFNRNKLMRSIYYARRHNQSPISTLERVAGLLMIGWADIAFRKYCRHLVKWLIDRYGKLLANDPEWKNALCGYKTDPEMFLLFTGMMPTQWQQSYGEHGERLNKPHKLDMATARVHKADQFVRRKLIDKGLMTEEGWSWVRQALDPFHDENLDAVGFCDGFNGSTTTTEVKQSIQIVSNQGAVNNWDMHIFTLPWFYNTPMDTNSLITPPATPAGTLQVASVAGNVFNTGYVNVHGFAANAPMGFNNLLPATYIASASANVGAFPSDARIVSQAYELHNTTAPLYKQGTITTYRMPSESNSVATYNLATIATPGVNLFSSSQWIEMQPFPASANQALALQGTLQWEAKHGAYIVNAMSGVENPMQAAEYVGNYFYNANAGAFGQYWPVGVIASANLTTVTYTPPLQQNIPFHRSGIIVQGSSPQSSYTLTIRTVIERNPSPFIVAEQDYCRLAKRALQRDPMALALYTHAVKNLPIGCMVGENALGDWFYDAVNAVLGAAAPVVSAAFPEFAPLIMGGSAAATSFLNKMKTDGQKAKKDRKKVKKDTKRIRKDWNVALKANNGIISPNPTGKLIGPRRQPIASNFVGPMKANQRRLGSRKRRAAAAAFNNNGPGM